MHVQQHIHTAGKPAAVLASHLKQPPWRPTSSSCARSSCGHLSPCAYEDCRGRYLRRGQRKSVGACIRPPPAAYAQGPATKLKHAASLTHGDVRRPGKRASGHAAPTKEGARRMPRSWHAAMQPCLETGRCRRLCEAAAHSRRGFRSASARCAVLAAGGAARCQAGLPESSPPLLGFLPIQKGAVTGHARFALCRAHPCLNLNTS